MSQDSGRSPAPLRTNSLPLPAGLTPPTTQDTGVLGPVVPTPHHAWFPEGHRPGDLSQCFTSKELASLEVGDAALRA